MAAKRLVLSLIWITGLCLVFIIYARYEGYIVILEKGLSYSQLAHGHGCQNMTHQNDIKLFSSMVLNPALLVPLSNTNLNTWNFNKSVICPVFNISNTEKNRTNLKFTCGVNGTCISYKMSPSIHVTSFPFGDLCVSDIIHKYCNDSKPVPNVLHYIWYGKVEVKYHHFLSFMSAVRYMKPCLIIFHGEHLPYGKYWDYFTSKYYKLLHLRRPLVTSIYGQKLSFNEHGADVMGIEALHHYGGLYIDSDTVILRSVDELRNYNFTMSHEDPNTLGNQFIMARKGAKFLDLWHDAYKKYRKGAWTYNSLQVPYQIAQKNPNLIRIEDDKFCRPNWVNRHLIFQKNFNWTINYAMHLFIRMYKTKTDEFIIRKLNTTYGAVSRHILFGNKELCL